MVTSFSLFAIFLRIFLMPSSDALIIVHHQQITADMREALESADYPENDPLGLKNLQTRQSICDYVISAREYHAINTKKKNVEEPASSSSQTLVEPATTNFQLIHGKNDPDYLHLAVKKVTLEIAFGIKKSISMKMLECVNTAERHWFVGFGWERERARMFLIEQVEYESYAARRWIASLESNGRYNIIFRGPDKTERFREYFATQADEDATFPEIKRNKRPRKKDVRRLSENMTLCCLNFSEHARLCSVIFETVAPRWYHQVALKRVNYVHINQRRCMKKRVELADELVRVDVVPCAVNRDQKSPQFFVLADPKKLGAAFVFITNDGQASRLKLKARVEDLQVLIQRRGSSRTPTDVENETKSEDSSGGSSPPHPRPTLLWRKRKTREEGESSEI